MIKETALIVFIKNLIPGKVKTRLAATIGEKAAMDIYQELVSITRHQVDQVPFDVYWYFSDFIPSENGFGSHNQRIQEKGDLGSRMSQAFQEVFEAGHKKVLIIGTDCPRLTLSILVKAEHALDQSEVVIGPAEDGGYYLIGTNSFYPELFKGINWSTSSVLKQTIQLVGELKLTYQFLERLSDIDLEEDWNKYLEIKQKLL